MIKRNIKIVELNYEAQSIDTTILDLKPRDYIVATTLDGFHIRIGHMVKQKEELPLNSQQFRELEIDLKGSILKGSNSDTSNIKNHYTRFSVFRNDTGLHEAMMVSCRARPECAKHLVSDD